MTALRYRFRVHGERLAIVRLAPDAPAPAWARGRFVATTRTPDELSIVCPQDRVPPGVRHEPDRIAVSIEGPLPLQTIGVLAGLCSVLAAASVPVFAISTFATDWLLVEANRFPAAREALAAAGHEMVGEPP
jgi:hypothetical protein